MKNSPALIGFNTMARKELVRIFRIWSQTLLPPVVTTTLYFVIFGAFIGSQVAPIAGYSYMQFIMPGLIMMTIITSAYMNTVSTFYFTKWQNTIDELLVSPMPRWSIIAGYIFGGVARAMIVGVLVLIVSLFFTHLHVANPFIIFAAAFMTALLFSLAGLVNGIFAKTFDAISIVPTFVLTPLTYLGGVFYSVSMLPPIFQTISFFNPILYMVNAFRYGFLGISDVSVGLSFAIMGGISVVLLVLSLWLFKRGVGLKN
ncbi:MAG: Transport permease protein [Parcubacteria group bacterium]|nr:Transport permease protein [Parcubacteria group bacterium]